MSSISGLPRWVSTYDQLQEKGWVYPEHIYYKYQEKQGVSEPDPKKSNYTALLWPV